jgi:hypothetical protein
LKTYLRGKFWYAVHCFAKLRTVVLGVNFILSWFKLLVVPILHEIVARLLY